MSIHAYLVFQTVVATGSFTKAAQQLSLSQPAVSHSVRSLEKELGVQLLRRGGAVKLTEIGEELMPHVHALVATQARIQQIADELHELKRGSIRLGSFPSLTAGILPNLLRVFRERHPGITVSIQDDGYAEIERGLSLGEYDLAFLPYESRKFDSRLCFEDRYVAIAALDFPDPAQGRMTLQQLDGCSLILPMDGCEQVLLPLFEKSGVSPHIEYELKHALSIIGMVAQGIGLSIVPEGTANLVSSVKSLPLEPPIFRQLYAATRKGDELSPAVRTFLRYIASR